MKNFEERLGRLEEITTKIKEPALPLEDAFSLFEEGVKLAGSLEKDVEKLEGRVQILMNGEELAKEATQKTATKRKKQKNECELEPEFGLFASEDFGE
ncbi:MAG: exodeoxyribonuclease VII small subunit [Treponemataceae bacterium]